MRLLILWVAVLIGCGSPPAASPPANAATANRLSDTDLSQRLFLLDVAGAQGYDIVAAPERRAASPAEEAKRLAREGGDFNADKPRRQLRFSRPYQEPFIELVAEGKAGESWEKVQEHLWADLLLAKSQLGSDFCLRAPIASANDIPAPFGTKTREHRAAGFLWTLTVVDARRSGAQEPVWRVALKWKSVPLDPPRPIELQPWAADEDAQAGRPGKPDGIDPNSPAVYGGGKRLPAKTP